MWLKLPINPEPWAVGTTYSYFRNGKHRAGMSPNAQLVSYQEAVKETTLAYLELHGITPEQVMLCEFNKLTIYGWRRLDDYETNSGRRHRKHVVDATNVLKGTEDALQGILFANDKTNLDVRCVLVDQGPDVTGYIVLHLEEVNYLDLGAELSEVPSD